MFIQTNQNKKYGQILKIDKADINYLKFLYKTYTKFYLCVYDHYLSKINTFNKNFVRFMFYHQNEIDYKSKKVHYYKNVHSVFTHWAVDFENDTWSISTSPDSGHLIHHFRKTWKNINYISILRHLQ